VSRDRYHDVIVGTSRGRVVGDDGSRTGHTVRLPVSTLPRQQADLYRTDRLRLRRKTTAPIDRPNIAKM